MLQNIPLPTRSRSSLFPTRSCNTKNLFRWGVSAACAFLTTILLLSSAKGVDATFTHIGFLPGDDYSYVVGIDNAGSLAACRSFYFDGYTRVDSYAARWTPGEGIQPLPRLPTTAGAGTGTYSEGGRDVTADGSRIAFTGPTLDQNGVAAGISDADGGNLIALTSLPNGELMPAVSQLSNDGLTAFGYRLLNYYQQGALWTALGGIQALVPPSGYTNVAPALHAISSDGSVSAGTLFQVDPDNLSVTAEQAYRWTAAAGIAGLGYLPGETDSSTVAMSSSGTYILGRSGPSFFVWQEGQGLTEILPPQPPSGYYGFFGGAGLNGDGAVAVVTYEDLTNGTGAPDKSYILKTETGDYIDLEEALARAGAGAAIEGWRSFHCNGITDDGNTVFGQAINPDNRAEGFFVRFSPGFLQNLTPALPVITSPLSAEGFFGETFSYHITATGMPFDFSATGLPSGLEFNLASEAGGPLFGSISGQPTTTGVFSVTITATNSVGTTSAVLQLTISASATTPRLLNLSTRGEVLTGDNVLIGGFIIPDGQPKNVILRAIGPSLAPGIGNALVDPVLTLYKPDGSVVTNDNWKEAQQAAIAATGLAPSKDREAAILATLAPGSYTAIVSGKVGGVGVGLFEAYDLDSAAASKLGNISTRGHIDTGDNVLIGGVIANGTSVAYIVVRAIGPSLTDASVANALPDPVLELYSANGTLYASNDDWRDSAEADQIEAFGLAPTKDRESAIFSSVYDEPVTAIVRGKDGTTGVGLVEVYNVDY